MEPARNNQKLGTVSKGKGCLVGVGVGAGPAGGSEEAIQKEPLWELESGEGPTDYKRILASGPPGSSP